MYEFDKAKFGAFAAQLRKEKGYTQKELGEKLFISDKAISKWETGKTVPDTALLIPLADTLGVTVTELLAGERIEKQPLPPEAVEDIVKTAIVYNEAAPTRVWGEKGPWRIIYILGCLSGGICLFLLYQKDRLTTSVIINAILTFVFGAYFCFFARTKLPLYYDQNKISGIYDGFVRMHIPGLHFNNRNWPHIVNAARAALLTEMTVFPLLALIIGYFNFELWFSIERYVMLVLLLGALFVPIYIVGKIYE